MFRDVSGKYIRTKKDKKKNNVVTGTYVIVRTSPVYTVCKTMHIIRTSHVCTECNITHITCVHTRTHARDAEDAVAGAKFPPQ